MILVKITHDDFGEDYSYYWWKVNIMGCQALHQAMYYHTQNTVKWLSQGMDFWEATLNIGQSSLLITSVMVKTSLEITICGCISLY